jgi:hypothetical protein
MINQKSITAKHFTAKVFLIFLILGAVVFYKALNNPFVLDDTSQITQNTFVHSLDNIPQLFLGSSFGGSAEITGAYYKPLMTTSYALLYAIAGPNPFAFHFYQVSLHILNAFLVFLLLSFFVNRNISALMGLVFLVHPLNVENAVYIASLQDTLFLFFGLLAFLTLKSNIKNQILKNALFAICLLLSLLSKESGILFVAIIFVYNFLNRKSLADGILNIKQILIGVVSIIYLSLRTAAVGWPTGGHADAPYSMLRAPLLERIQSIPLQIYYYLKNFVWGQDLAIAQDWVVQKISWSNFAWPLIICAFLIFTLFYLYKNNKKSQFFVFWILIGFALHINVYPLDATVADRWFYFPMIGFLGLISINIEKFNAKATSGSIFIFIIFWSGVSYNRVLDWESGLSLTKKDILKNPNSFTLNNTFAFELFIADRWDEAQIYAEKSVELAPWWWLNWNNLGHIYRHKAMSDKSYLAKAEEAFKKACENTSGFYMPYENLAEMLLFYKSPKEAQEFIIQSGQKLNLSAKLWLLLIMSTALNNELDRAKSLAAEALKYHPSYPDLVQIEKGLRENLKLEFVKPVY